MQRLPRGLRDYVRTVGVNSIVVAPVAGSVVADSGALSAGLYDVLVAGSYGGTADTIDNMAVFVGATQVMSLPVAPVANSVPLFVTLPGIVVSQGEHVTVRAIAAGAAGTVYRGTIIATSVDTQYDR